MAKVPDHWRLSDSELSDAKKQRDLTGSFIRKFLTEDEIFITDQNATQIASAIQVGWLTALQVTEAFCKRAAIAHQIVCRIRKLFIDPR